MVCGLCQIPQPTQFTARNGQLWPVTACWMGCNCMLDGFQMTFSICFVSLLQCCCIFSNKNDTILMLIKIRPFQFTDFNENKYKHEHVMITNLYIVNHILYDHHLYEYILCAFCACLKEALGCTLPHPLWNVLSFSTS